MKGQRGFGVLSTVLLGVGLLAAPVIANNAEPRIWGPGQCHLDWCPPTAAQITDADAALQRAADVARLSLGCVPVGRATGAIPAEMVWQPSAGAPVERGAWTYPVPAGSTVWALCYGE